MFSLCQDEQKAAAMVGLSEEGPPKVDTEEVKHIVAKFYFDYNWPNNMFNRRVVTVSCKAKTSTV